MPAGDWYYAQDNRQLGPVTLAALANMLKSGHVKPSDLVWTESMPDWTPAAAVADLGLQPPPAPPVTQLSYFWPGSPTAQVVYAGFWLRFAAWIIDALILSAAGFFIGTALRVSARSSVVPVTMPGLFFGRGLGVTQLSMIVLRWLYYALMESSQYQATIGKLALGLAVTDAAGFRVTFARASGRYFSKYISELTLLIGYMMAGWTERKQALHDMISRCLVVRRR
jgi:uncharacterized RDD family membrane protein YckC